MLKPFCSTQVENEDFSFMYARGGVLVRNFDQAGIYEIKMKGIKS